MCGNNHNFPWNAHSGVLQAMASSMGFNTHALTQALNQAADTGCGNLSAIASVIVQTVASGNVGAAASAIAQAFASGHGVAVSQVVSQAYAQVRDICLRYHNIRNSRILALFLAMQASPT